MLALQPEHLPKTEDFENFQNSIESYRETPERKRFLRDFKRVREVVRIYDDSRDIGVALPQDLHSSVLEAVLVDNFIRKLLKINVLKLILL